MTATQRIGRGVLLTTWALLFQACGSSSTGPQHTGTPDAGDPKALVRVVVTPGTVSLPQNAHQQLTATAVLADGTTRDVTSSATWSSDPESIATVSNDSGSQGQLTGVATGTANVTGTYQGASASAEVTIVEARLIALVVSPGSASIAAGLTVAFTATGIYSNESARDVTADATWSSSDPSVTSVDPNDPGVFAAHAQGTATITATLGELTGSKPLNVTAPVLQSIALEPDTTSLVVGDTVQVHAIGTLSDGTQSDVTSQVAWSTSDPTILIVSGASGLPGEVQTEQVGSAYVLATLGSIQAVLQLQIKNVPNLFAAPVSYSTNGGGGGSGTDLLDVNHDGRMDVLGLRFASPRYYLNQGDGTLAAPVEIAHLSGDTITGSATGDLNGDGYDDLVLTADSQSDGSDHLLVFLNNQDGTFLKVHDFDPGAAGADVFTGDVTIADLDGDTYPDLIVGTGTGDVIDIYWGDALASYTATRTELSLTAPESIAVADFDGDQVPDLAVSRNEAAVVLLHNNGDRTFSQVSSTPVNIDFTPQLRAADFDHSGAMDLVVPSNALGGGIWVLIGQGDGTFATPVNYPAGSGDTFSLRTVDVNRDGNMDVLANDDQVGAIIYYGAGDGTFSPIKSVTAAGNLPQGAEATDLNGDRLPDVIVMSNSSSDGNALSVMLQIN